MFLCQMTPFFYVEWDNNYRNIKFICPDEEDCNTPILKNVSKVCRETLSGIVIEDVNGIKDFIERYADERIIEQGKELENRAHVPNFIIGVEE